jgi:hypothetical protein
MNDTGKLVVLTFRSAPGYHQPDSELCFERARLRRLRKNAILGSADLQASVQVIFLSFFAGFSLRGICFSAFFRSLFIVPQAASNQPGFSP